MKIPLDRLRRILAAARLKAQGGGAAAKAFTKGLNTPNKIALGTGAGVVGAGAGAGGYLAVRGNKHNRTEKIRQIGHEVFKANPPRVLARTRRKKGPEAARKQAVAIMLSKARRMGVRGVPPPA